MSKLHPSLGERRVANQDRRMPAEKRKPSAAKADGLRGGNVKGRVFRPAFLSVYVSWSGKRYSNPRHPAELGADGHSHLAEFLAAHEHPRVGASAYLK